MHCCVVRGFCLSDTCRAESSDAMRIVTLQHERTSQADAALPAELRPIVAALRRLLPEPGDLLPADDQIILRLWPRDLEIDCTQVPSLLDRLVVLGVLRRVIIGREAHLCLSRVPNRAKESGPAAATIQISAPSQSEATQEDPQEEKNAEHRLFQLQMTADVETERVLLFRVGIVLEFLGLLTLLRQILLWYLAL